MAHDGYPDYKADKIQVDVGPVYDPIVGLNPIEYWNRRHNSGAVPAFHGVEPYDWLKNDGRLLVGITVVRLEFNADRFDEFYGVVDDYQLEGIELPAHSGKAGAHRPEDVLTENGPNWDIANFDFRVNRAK